MIEFLKQFASNVNLQVIITTNSPFILSDIVKDNVICLQNSLNNNGTDTSATKNRDTNTFGQNIYTLLKNEFFLDSTYGEYFASKIIEVKKFIEYKDYKSNKYDEKLREYEFIIDNIGEPVIKNYLKNEIEKCKNEYYKKLPLSEQIEYYEKEIERLKSLQSKEGDRND